jgi:TRAP-type C4-dicarboxylate transport system permease small subunit
VANKNMCSFVSTWFDRCLYVLALLGAFILVFVTLDTSFEVVARYFFGVSLPWVFNVNQHLLAYVVFGGAAWVLREGQHIKIDLIETKMGQQKRNFLCFLQSLLSMVACAVMFWWGASAVLLSFRWGTTLPGPPAVSEYLLMGIIPLGCLLLTIQFGRDCWKYVNRFRRRE